jgi:hypothetical protein
MKVTTHFNLVPRLRMCETVLQLPNLHDVVRTPFPRSASL